MSSNNYQKKTNTLTKTKTLGIFLNALRKSHEIINNISEKLNNQCFDLNPRILESMFLEFDEFENELEELNENNKEPENIEKNSDLDSLNTEDNMNQYYNEEEIIEDRSEKSINKLKLQTILKDDLILLNGYSSIIEEHLDNPEIRELYTNFKDSIQNCR